MEIRKLEAGGRTYRIYKQSDDHGEFSEYMRKHGCSTCAMTCLLSGYVPELAERTPEETASLLKEKYPANFRRPMALQMPISMYGIKKVLDKYGIKNRYIWDYKDDEAVKEIRNHLKADNPVIITLRNKDGEGKWAGSVHTMVLVGLDDEYKAIVCDSAERKWAESGDQRVKHGEIEELVSFMWPSKHPSESMFYKGRRGASGYILVY